MGTGDPGPALVQHVSAQSAAARQGDKAILRGWQEQVQGLDQYSFSMTSLLDGLISLIKDFKLGAQKVSSNRNRTELHSVRQHVLESGSLWKRQCLNCKQFHSKRRLCKVSRQTPDRIQAKFTLLALHHGK